MGSQESCSRESCLAIDMRDRGRVSRQSRVVFEGGFVGNQESCSRESEKAIKSRVQ